MRNSKQSSVEWLEIELEKLWVEKYLSPITIKPLLDKAKEMDQRQKILDYEIGYINGGNQKKITGEQYYNETYGDETPTT